jgi:hypothetical protein
MFLCCSKNTRVISTIVPFKEKSFPVHMVKDRVFVAAAEFGKVQLFCFLSEAKLFT